MTRNTQRVVRTAAAAFAIAAVVGCSQAGSLGNVLGSVLNGQGQGQSQGSQVSGSIQSVDARNQQINLRQSNGQTVALGYDAQTKVVYRNQSYGVTSLEYGDQVTMRVQSTQNGGYYTDLVQVDQPVAGSGTNGSSGTNNSQVQNLQGTVRRIDSSNGLFEIGATNNVVLTVSMPYNPSRADQQRFQNLRAGDAVRFAGVYLNNTRVELRQFY